MNKRTKLTIRQIRGINNFLDNCLRHTQSDDLAHLYRAAKITRARIGHTVLKGA